LFKFMFRVSLIIPTYNEAKNLPLLFEEIWNIFDKSQIDLEFIIVDDNSPDGTGQAAEDLINKYPIKVIHRSGKLGLGSAVIEGFKLSDRPYLGVMDADLSHDPAILNDLILSLDEYDVALGSRFAEGSTVENWIWWRKALSNVGVNLARILTKVKDPLSGYFFFKRRVIQGIDLKTKGYKILLEVLVKGKFNKLKEVAYKFRMRKYSDSKLQTKEYLLFLGQLIKYTFYKLMHKNI
jgi:dolichol-phosphate mannosyltransferase